MTRVTLESSTHSPAMKFLWCALMRAPDQEADLVRGAKSNQASPRQIAHQSAGAERPALAFLARQHAIDQLSELRRADGDDVAGFVGEAHAGGAAIRDWREHRAQEKDESVRVGMVRTQSLGDKIGGVSADLGHRRASFEHEAVIALDFQRNDRFADVV